MAQRLAVAEEARRAVGQVAGVLLVADRDAAVRPRAQAVDALAALGREQRDHVVARLHERHALADRLDDAGALVPEHARRVAGRVGARGGVHVGVADAARGQADERLARPGLGQVDLLHDERLPELLQHCGADPHRRDSPAPAACVARLPFLGWARSEGGSPSAEALHGHRRRHAARRRSGGRRRAGANAPRWKVWICKPGQERRLVQRRHARHGHRREREAPHRLRALVGEAAGRLLLPLPVDPRATRRT